MGKTYSPIYLCRNCGRDVKIKIPFGTKAKGLKPYCPKCGVKMLLGEIENLKEE